MVQPGPNFSPSILVLGAAETLVGLNDAFVSAPGLRGVYLPKVRDIAPPAATKRRALTD